MQYLLLFISLLVLSRSFHLPLCLHHLWGPRLIFFMVLSRQNEKARMCAPYIRICPQLSPLLAIHIRVSPLFGTRLSIILSRKLLGFDPKMKRLIDGAFAELHFSVTSGVESEAMCVLRL
ncbi:hypothetical protein ARMSODRAFT_960895 [Armillaria solidipes]|uniref:Secreted protein n=1 Tax=Armillaria solidipes TaxID=1076256 RepID=A0A2H3BIX7_9AGAR|nr:hypothetical protein ARMSODRAFT_960895 [Armillaria solidipes]